MMPRWRIVALGVVIVVIAATAYAFWRWPAVLQAVFGPPAATDQVMVSGNIEAHESVLSFTQVQAPIVELPFDEGAVVQSGTVLARIDDRPYQQQVEIDAGLGIRCTLRHGVVPVDAAGGLGYLLDWDVYQDEVRAFDALAIRDWLVGSHRLVLQLFQQAITAQLLDTLRR